MGIVWLASYPKSGNTWFRVFLTNHLRDAAEPASINALEATPIASNRSSFAQVLGFDAADLTPDEYDDLRPHVYRAIAARETDTQYMKVHDANTTTPSGEALLPADATDRAVCLVRDPRDVACSFANHSSISVDEAIDRMGRSFSFAAGRRGLPNQLRQRLLTWSEHVTSWLDETAYPVHCMRYEDTVADPLASFGAAVDFLGLPSDPDRLERAVRFAGFDEVRRQEEADGFGEAPFATEFFFRQGRAGGWRTELTESQSARIVDDHHGVMARLGYLDED